MASRGRKRNPGIPMTLEEIQQVLGGSGSGSEPLAEDPAWEEEALPFTWEPDTMKEARGDA